MSYKVETILEKVTPGCGEGPHWDEVSQTLLFVDIPGGNIHRYNPNTGKDNVLQLDGFVGFVIPRKKGGLVIGHNRTISVVNWGTKEITKLVEVEQGTNNRFNDGKCDPRGRIWAGTMGIDLKPIGGGLYCLDTDGTLTKKLSNVCISNGLAWFGDTMYFIDTTLRKVYSFDYDVNTGNIANKKVLVDYDLVPELEGMYPGPDGMTVDTDGNLWVACIGGSCIIKCQPKTGKLLQKVDIPGATQITSMCWGGKNLDELYVTSLRINLSEADLQTVDKLAGSLFRITGLGARGFPSVVYQG